MAERNKIVTCPNPDCQREGVEVINGVIEPHYPSSKKTFSPIRKCELSGKEYSKLLVMRED